jgi:hypothetical protein
MAAFTTIHFQHISRVFVCGKPVQANVMQHYFLSGQSYEENKVLYSAKSFRLASSGSSRLGYGNLGPLSQQFI